MKNKLIISLISLVIISIFAIMWFESKTVELFKVEDRMEITEFVEIDDYKGENFSDFDAFRENSIKGPQYVNEESYELKITGLVDNQKSLKYQEVLDNYMSYKKVAKLNCVEGWDVKILWEGVLVSDLLKEINVKPEANRIIFKAYDGYTTSFPLEYVLDNNIIMAYKMNDEVMPKERGFPFQLVAESKWGYKWIKWITEIELSNDDNYEGYWESRGYSNTGDLDKSKYD